MKKYQKIIITALLWSLITIIFSAGIAIAQEDKNITYKMQVGIPGTDFADEITMDKGSTYYIALFVQAIYKYGISVVAILAAVMIMAGGIIWLTSAGSQERVGKAKDLIIGSLTGLILLFGSWVVLNTINPRLVNFDLSNIDNIYKLEIGCCIEESVGLNQQTYNIAQMKTKIDCNGTWYDKNYAPNTYEIRGTMGSQYNASAGSACVKRGCCSAVITGVTVSNFLQLGVDSVFLNFPTNRNDCPDNLNNSDWLGAAYISYSWSDKYCDYSENVIDCTNQNNGTLCLSDNRALTNCNSDGNCGFCYFGSCLVNLGKINEKCGSNGHCVNSCPNNYILDQNGRKCVNGLMCCKPAS